MAVTHASGLEVRSWTRAEYHQLIEHGFFDPEERAELIDGEILRMPRQYSPHAATVTHVHQVLADAFGRDYHVRIQMPVALDPMSEPEPDLAVVTGAPLDYVEEHPDTAALLIEVADTTVAYDRNWKASLYARAGIPEYWIVNLGDRLLEVRHTPAEHPAARYGWGYASVERLDPSATVFPLAAPEARIAVADLLP